MAEWTIQQVADRFREAALTAYRLPATQFTGYMSFWPDIDRRGWEGYAETRLMRMPASPAEVDRFVETTHWLRWLDEPQRHLVWARARHRPWKLICAQLHCNRVTARRRWLHALAMVVVGLNERPPRIADR